MLFNLYSTKAGSIQSFIAILGSLVKPPVAVTLSNAHNGVTEELSLLDLFEVSRAYFERFGEKATTMESDRYPTVTASLKVGERGDLEFKVISQVVRGGVSLHLYIYGRRGTVELGIERSAWSSRSAPKGDMIIDAQFYGTNAANEPFFIEGRESFASELLALWYAKDDEAIIKQMANLYEMLTPKKPLPAYVIISQTQQFPDCSEDAAEGQRVTVQPGLYTLSRGNYDNPRAAYKQVLRDEHGYHSTNAGMELTEWEAAEAASDGAIELVYHRDAFACMPQVGLADEITARQAHDGQPFHVLSASFSEGFITGYSIYFNDGFETTASPEEIELIFDDEEQKLSALESAVLQLMRDRADGQAAHDRTGLSLGRVGDALEAEAPNSLAWDWNSLEQALSHLVKLGLLVHEEEGFFKLPEWYIPATAQATPSAT